MTASPGAPYNFHLATCPNHQCRRMSRLAVDGDLVRCPHCKAIVPRSQHGNSQGHCPGCHAEGLAALQDGTARAPFTTAVKPCPICLLVQQAP